MLLQRDIINFKKAKKGKRSPKKVGSPFRFLRDLQTEDIEEGTRARVVFGQGEHVILFRLSETSTSFWQADQDYLRKLQGKGIIEVEVTRTEGPKPDPLRTKVQIARRDEAWELIEPLVRMAPQIYNKRVRVDAIRERAKKACRDLVQSGTVDRRNEKTGLKDGSAERKIQNLLRRYWCRGMTPDALIPDYDKVGGPGLKKVYKGNGQKRSFGKDREVCRITPEIEAVFKRMTDQYYSGKQRGSLRKCFEQARGCLADEQLSKGMGLKLRTKQAEWTDKVALPTYRQYLYWYKKANRSARDEVGKLGQSSFDMGKRARFGSSLQNLFGVGSRFEIDATLLDIGCVSKFDRKSYVGRPTLYVVIDVYSRMIVGLYVGFENPSWHTFGMALRNVAEDKVDYCARFGVHIEPEEWPVRNVMPARILADRGEGEGYKASELVTKTGIKIENTAGYRGDMKGTVERRFGLINDFLRLILPGVVTGDHMKRGDEDYRRRAKVNIDEVTRAIIRAVLLHNNSNILKGFRQPKEMVASKINSIPRDMWHWALKSGHSELKGFSPGELDLALLQSDYATPEKKGLRFQGMHYKSLEHYEDGYAHKIGAAHRQLVSWDMSSTSVIWRHRPDGTVEECTLLEDYAAYAGMSFSEAHKLRIEQNERHAKAEIAASLAFREATKAIEADLKEAEFENPQSLLPSSIARAAGSRKTEVEIERMQERLRRALRARTADSVSGSRPAKSNAKNPLNAV